MPYRDIIKDSTSLILKVFLRDSTTGLGKTGVAAASMSGDYCKDDNTADTALSFSAGAVTDAYSSGKWAEVGNGYYFYHFPNASWTTFGETGFSFRASGAIDAAPKFRVVAIDSEDAVRAGLTAMPNAAADDPGGLPISDAGGLDLDAILEDTTAITTAIDAIGATSGGSVNIEATQDNTGGAIDPSSAAFVGSVQSGTYASTEAEDGTLHDIDDTGDDIDIVYGFDVGAARVATSITFAGFVQGVSDEIKIKAYDHVGTDWEIIGTVSGQAGTSNILIDRPLLLKHTGTTGAEIGKVYIRFETDSTTPSNLSVDQLLIAAVTSAGGVPNGSTVTLSASTTNTNYAGNNWNLALGGQDISGSYFKGATVTGTSSGSTEVTFEDCLMGACTIPPSRLLRSGFGQASGTLTLASAGAYRIYGNSTSAVAGAASPVIDCTAGAGNITLELRGHHGGVTLNGLKSGDVVTIGGSDMGTITLNGADAAVEVRGIWKAVTNSLTGSPTVTLSGVEGTDVADILVDTNSLNDTKIPQTLNLTASGNIGIDWANVENPTTAVPLSATDIQLCDTVTTLTGHTVQTGDSYAYLDTNLGALGANATEAGGTGDQFSALPTDDSIANAVWLEPWAGQISDPLKWGGLLIQYLSNIQTYTYDWADGQRLDLILDAIVADTNELQTDWADGGRLDLLLDALPTAAEIYSEFTSGSNEDAFKADVSGDLLPYFQLLVRSDAAIATDRAAELALLNADEASGAGDYTPTQEAQEGIYDAIGGIGGAIGPGSVLREVLVQKSGVPVDGAATWVSTDAAGANVIAGTRYTDGNGLVTYMLDAGTYYIWAQRNGVDFSNPSTYVAA